MGVARRGTRISASDKKFGRGSNLVGTIPAAAIEALVLREVHAVLQAPEMVQAVWDEIRRRNVVLDEPAVVLAMRNLACLWQELFPAAQARLVRLLIERVQFREDGVQLSARNRGKDLGQGDLDEAGLVDRKGVCVGGHCVTAFVLMTLV